MNRYLEHIFRLGFYLESGINEPDQCELWGSLRAQLVRNPAAVQETPVLFLSPEDPLEKGHATHSCILRLPLWLSW